MAKSVSPVKVNRADGTVTVNGEVRGRVEKTTDGTSFMSAISGNPGPAMWFAIDKDGERLFRSPFRTQRDAVDVVVKASEPMKIDAFERDRFGSNRWVTGVTVRGSHFGVSRAAGSEYWLVHYIHMLGAIMPSLSTLPGCNGQAIVRQEVIDALNQAATDAGISFTA